MTDVVLNTSEANVTLETQNSEAAFDFPSNGAGTVGEQTGVFTCARSVTLTKIEIVADGDYLNPFSVAPGAELPVYLYYNTGMSVGSTLDVEASFAPPVAGTYHAIMRVHSITGYQDIAITGTGV